MNKTVRFTFLILAVLMVTSVFVCGFTANAAEDEIT